MVKITNPINGKAIIAEVKSNKVKFSERLKKLSSIVFYNDLGTLLDRSIRIQKLCIKISIFDLGRSNNF